ncbi:hypothetical protein [Mycobacteroides franklinii]|uniref:hypothetical protein n=1 Tax=Mycobacteroides franklinii TaxID=948102 RepID=UPI000993008F|nr:hypothetical protein [Mycobacteroides franklinii]
MDPNRRYKLIARARELDVFPDPESRTDEQLSDAIAAEEAATLWLQRLEQLPTDEAKRAAIHRLAQSLSSF